MKTIFAILLIASSEAFVPTSHVKFGVPSTALFAESADDAIKAALLASKTHGPTSKEARIAWETVEEINASDNSAAFKGGVSDEDIHANTKAAQEYQEKVDALSKLLDEQRAQIESVKELASNIRSVKLAQPETSPQGVSDAMVAALADANKLTKEFGVGSTEAILAWETVEEIASNGYSEEIKNDLSEECLIETIEACEAIEEMQRALHVNELAGSGRYQG